MSNKSKNIPVVKNNVDLSPITESSLKGDFISPENLKTVSKMSGISEKILLPIM